MGSSTCRILLITIKHLIISTKETGEHYRDMPLAYRSFFVTKRNRPQRHDSIFGEVES